MGKKTHIKIDIAVRDYYGCNNTAIVFSGMMFWFQIMPDGFYKFKQACKKHPLWRKGDSWGEELGMSRKTLDPILDKLVNKHKTKGEFLKQTDPFKGKMFASYTNHKTSQTYYFMNKEAVDEFLGSLNIKRKEIHPPSPICKGIESKKQEPLVMSQNQPCDVPTVHPLACARLTAINTQTNTSLVRDVPSEVGELAVEEEKLSSKKMIESWNSITQDNVVLYPSMVAKLSKVLKDFFGGCLEAFRKYCESIASSQFLMGKAPNSKFKAFFYWAIKPEVIKSIFQGAYGVKDYISQICNPNVVNVKPRDMKEEIDSSDDPEPVKAIREKILLEIGCAAYKSWFSREHTAMKIADGELFLTASGNWSANEIKSRYENTLKRILVGHELGLSITFPSNNFVQTGFDNPIKKPDQSSTKNIVPVLKMAEKTKAIVSNVSGSFSNLRGQYGKKSVSPNNDIVELTKVEEDGELLSEATRFERAVQSLINCTTSLKESYSV